MSSTMELMNEMNDMRHQMKSLLNSHKKMTRAFLRKVGDQTAKIARLEREKMFTDASFRRIYSEFSDYRTQTDLRIEELTKDLDDQKNIVRNLSRVMWGNPNSDSGDVGSEDVGSGDVAPEDFDPEDFDVIIETNEPDNPYIFYNNLENSLNNYSSIINNMRNLYNIVQNNENLEDFHNNGPHSLRRGSIPSTSTPEPPPPPPRFIVPEGVEIPHEFLCPITLEIMQDPVIASDGNTYERSAILHHISMHAEYPRSPLTRDVLQSNILIANNNLVKMIEDFCMAQVVSTQE
jgi:hypothetical protein